jgi:hypothetical protein
MTLEQTPTGKQKSTPRTPPQKQTTTAAKDYNSSRPTPNTAKTTLRGAARTG